MKTRKLYYAGTKTDHYSRKSVDPFFEVYFYSRHFNQFNHRNDYETVYTIKDKVWRDFMEYDKSKKAWIAKTGTVIFSKIAEKVEAVPMDIY